MQCSMRSIRPQNKKEAQIASFFNYFLGKGLFLFIH